MRPNTAENTTVLVAEHDAPTKPIATPAGDPREFAKELRALGQAIEKFSFSAFDLQIDSGIYVVTGRASIPLEKVRFSFSRFVRELLQGSNPTPTVTTAAGQIDLRFSPEEIEKFDVRGRVKRQDPGKMPDPYSVSQILRGAGSYLDNRDATSLVGITLQDRWVTVSYQTAEGRLEQAKQDLEYYYNYWVKMYMRRSNRTKLPPPSDPTLYVNWVGIRKTHCLSNVPG
ncbi:MAG TPA: hypothetical protein VGK77_26970 [Candidatus Binatia bacterium]|jgi:hypothetical protein